MKRESQRKRIEAKVEAMVDKAFALLAVEFEREVQSQLDRWAKAYPRHKFHALEGNGSLSFYCEPALYGSDHMAGSFNYVSYRINRGAVATMLKEAEELNDWYISLEWKVMPAFDSGTRIDSEPA